MAEIGSGSGSGYPSAIDTDTTTETNTDYARKQVPNDLAAAVVAIETELGINPSGTAYATVVLRLNAVSATGGGVPSGLESAKPAAAAGVLYKSTDSGLWYISDGSAWFPLTVG